MIELALRSHLLSREPVTAIVGQRVYVDRVPKDVERPRLLLVPGGGAARHYHSLGASGLVEANIAVHCQCRSYQQSVELYEAVRREIDGTKAQWATMTVDAAFLGTHISGSILPSSGDDVGYPSAVAVLQVFYYEELC